MKQWDAEKLKKMYPAMTDEFSARMDALVRSLPFREEEPKMKRKLSLGLVLALVLILAATATAVAAGLGAFGQLANAHDPDARLNDLENMASPVQQTIQTDDGITVTIDQAYYDGERVFISYQLSGSLLRTEGSGKGELEGVSWFNEDYDIAVDPDSPAAAVIEELRSKEKDAWVHVVSAALHDGLSLTDGTYLDIIGGEERLLPDGTVLGWKECEVPKTLAADTLSCKAVLFRTITTYQKTERGLRAAFARGSEETDIPFTVQKETQVTHLAGESEVGGLYTARADCSMNRVDLKGNVVLECPEGWVKAWMDWDYERDFDVIEGWVLYSGEERIGNEGNDRGVSGEGTTLNYEEIIRHGGHMEDLKLVPVYADSGEHMDEAILLTPQ